MKQLKRKLDNMRLLVVGLARSGTAAARLADSFGASVTVTDIRSEKELKNNLLRLSPRTTVRLGKITASECASFDLVILSPGVNPEQDWIREAESKGTRFVGEIEFASSLLEGRILGITGTNGKTTTTRLTGAMLSASGIDNEVAGNVGTPLSEKVLLASRQGRKPLFVTELSSFQLEKTENLSCRIAVLLNCTPDHLDRYPDFETYRKTKLRIFRNQSDNDFTIVNADNPFLMKETSKLASCCFPFSLSAPLDQGIFQEGEHFWAVRGGERVQLLRKDDIRLRGGHNLENVAASLAASFLSGANPESLSRAVRGFNGLEHRLEFVTDIAGVDYFNDSKSTTCQSTCKAIEALSGRIVLIMGGFDKGEDFSCLKPAVASRVSHLVLLGATADKIKEKLQGATEILMAADLEQAIATAASLAASGETVLFSPACASFDMFNDYEHRGKTFKSLLLSHKSTRNHRLSEVNSE